MIIDQNLAVKPAFSVNNRLKNISKPCELLNGYIISGRYPGDLPFKSTTAGDAQRVIEASEEVEQFIRDKK